MATQRGAGMLPPPMPGCLHYLIAARHARRNAHMDEIDPDAMQSGRRVHHGSRPDEVEIITSQLFDSPQLGTLRTTASCEHSWRAQRLWRS